jgi:hypothetical protein
MFYLFAHHPLALQILIGAASFHGAYRVDAGVPGILNRATG